MDTPRPETRLGNDEATAFFAKTIRHWHPYIVVAHLGMPAFTDMIEHRQGAHQLQSRRLEGHQNHGGASVGWCLGVSYCHDNGDAAVGMIGMAGKPLASSDDVGVPVPDGARLEIGGIRTRHLWLSHGETTAYLTVQQRFKPLPPLGSGS